jgi:hypothetical protein
LGAAERLVLVLMLLLLLQTLQEDAAQRPGPPR